MSLIRSLIIILYLILGFLASQFFHLFVYRVRGAVSYMTWFKNFNISSTEPTYNITIILCFILSLVISVSLFIVLRKIDSYNTVTILNYGFFLTLIYALLSQMIFSSVMRLGYETLFCLIVLFAILIDKIFISGPQVNIPTLSRYQEIWDLIKFATPILIGVPLLTGGVGFITAFYQNEPLVIKYQIYRHIFMALYFEIGAFGFIIIPLFRKVIELRNSL